MSQEFVDIITAALIVGLLLAGLRLIERNAVPMLLTYFALLFMLPSKLVLPGFGAIGGPATIFGVCLFVWWVAGVCIRALGFVRSPNLVRVAIFTYAAVFLTSYALAPMRARTELEVSGGDRAAIQLFAWLGVALVACDGLRTMKQVHAVIRGILVLLSVVGIIGIVQFSFQFDLVQYIRPPGLILNDEIDTFKTRALFLRPYSTTQHPIELAVLMSCGIPLALFYALHGRAAAGLLKGYGLPPLVGWAIAGTLGMAMMMTVSRAGILCTVVALFILALGWPMRWWLVGAGLLFIFIGIVRLVVPGLLDIVGALFEDTEKDPSIQGRLEDIAMLERLLPRVWQHGLGPGSWSKVDYFILDNEFFVTTMEMGVPGLFALGFIFGTCIVVLIRVMRKHSFNTRFALTLCAVFLAQIASMVTFDAFDFQQFAGFFFFTVGVIGAVWRLSIYGDADDAPALARLRRPKKERQKKQKKQRSEAVEPGDNVDHTESTLVTAGAGNS